MRDVFSDKNSDDWDNKRLTAYLCNMTWTLAVYNGIVKELGEHLFPGSNRLNFLCGHKEYGDCFMADFPDGTRKYRRFEEYQMRAKCKDFLLDYVNLTVREKKRELW